MKMNTIIWWESQIERDYIYLLEIDKSVLAYQGQPFRITYSDNGILRTYTPDFWVTRPDKQQVVEVKPVSKINSPENLNLFRHIHILCQQQGREFVVVTDTMIRIQPKLNVIRIWGNEIRA
ncbi:TnsA endonuclease (plasmid) [Cylindrospermum stagnale PCC 7417]|uniref:TnsA endonuclease n=2 Tax=Cylindrospermum stagnale TaxID=142864 RepID=K9XAB6_9NOST|nr:TnsA endonuclease [Cylindrospermum stagnale PCC 7417]